MTMLPIKWIREDPPGNFLFRIKQHKIRVERRDDSGAVYDFTFVAGPAAGYGFTQSADRPLSRREARRKAAAFIDQLDPVTWRLDE